MDEARTHTARQIFGRKDASSATGPVRSALVPASTLGVGSSVSGLDPHAGAPLNCRPVCVCVERPRANVLSGGTAWRARPYRLERPEAPERTHHAVHRCIHAERAGSGAGDEPANSGCEIWRARVA